MPLSEYGTVLGVLAVAVLLGSGGGTVFAAQDTPSSDTHSKAVCEESLHEEGSGGASAGQVVLVVVLTATLTLVGRHLVLVAWKRYKEKRGNNAAFLPRSSASRENVQDAQVARDAFSYENQGFKVDLREECDVGQRQQLPQRYLLQETGIKCSNVPKDCRSQEDNEKTTVTLKSKDFAGLGFSIYGNMRDGIFIKDILQKGPAYESEKLTSGDRIDSIRINFEHVAYEDALAILSYASPYEVKLTVKNKGTCTVDRKPVMSQEDVRLQIDHSTFLAKSSSLVDLLQNNLQKDRERVTRQPEILVDAKNCHSAGSVASLSLINERAKRLGVKVLPVAETNTSTELFQNDNNVNIERKDFQDEGDGRVSPGREPETEASRTVIVDRAVNGSGIRRDASGIPQEIPNFMLNAAVAARKNRRGNDDRGEVVGPASPPPRRPKGRAPRPPDDVPNGCPEDEKNTEKLPISQTEPIQTGSERFSQELVKNGFEEDVEIAPEKKLAENSLSDKTVEDVPASVSIDCVENASPSLTIIEKVPESRTDKFSDELESFQKHIESSLENVSAKKSAQQFEDPEVKPLESVSSRPANEENGSKSVLVVKDRAALRRARTEGDLGVRERAHQRCSASEATFPCGGGDATEELRRIQEKAERQLKKLPQLKYSVSSGDLSAGRPNVRRSESSVSLKSRIPVATPKTPPALVADSQLKWDATGFASTKRLARALSFSADTGNSFYYKSPANNNNNVNLDNHFNAKHVG